MTHQVELLTQGQPYETTQLKYLHVGSLSQMHKFIEFILHLFSVGFI